MTARGLLNRAGWMLDSFTWFFASPAYRHILRRRPRADVTLGIATFKDRFESCLKPLLPKLHTLFPHDRILIMANGHYRKQEQEAYIMQLKTYCSLFPNTEVEAYIDPKGLSYLWNRIIKKADAGNVLILNDDIMIKPGFRQFIMQHDFRAAPLALINQSLSHFKISRELPGKIGFFDEGFTEIGGEDDDYLARMAMAGMKVENFNTGTVARRKIRVMKDMLNSYGRKMSEQRGGYSTVNSDYLETKWEIRKEPFPGSVEVPMRKNQYWKLRAGFTESGNVTKN